MTDRHRDRRGRGLRGPLVPSGAPLARTRSQRFDELVLDAVERLELEWAESLRGIEFAVEDVPPPPIDGPRPPESVRLGSNIPAAAGEPARVVVYRRPIEARVSGERARGALVQDVVVEQVAELLGLEPETLDPDYGAEPG
jgi:predicted Zn-dependent protease with MMP-like domain